MFKALKNLVDNYNVKIIKSKRRKSAPKHTAEELEELEQQAEELYFDILPSAWNVKDTKHPFQCYCIRAAQMCIDMLKSYGNYDFLDCVEEACRLWLSHRERTISLGYKYPNPYSPFMVFLIELCARLKKLQKKWKVKVEGKHPPERRFQLLILTSLSNCFEKTLLRNKEQMNFAIQVMKKVMNDGDIKLQPIEHFMERNTSFILNEDVARFFRTKICTVIRNLNQSDN